MAVWIETIRRCACGALRAFARAALRYMERHHVAAVIGLEHLPAGGPYLVVANHRSYMDNFLIACALWRRHGTQVDVPTNVKAFKGWLRDFCHRALGGVPIDPSNPQQAYAAIEELLGAGRVVLMYPEGTRSTGAGLLPFRYGAFNIAAKLGIPIVPAGLVNTAGVLPKGALIPVRGQYASVAFGAPIAPEFVAEHGVEATKDLCRETIERLINTVARGDLNGTAAATQLAAAAEARIEALLEDGAERIRPPDLHEVWSLLRLARVNDRDNAAVGVQWARAYGFAVMTSFWLLAACRLGRLRRMARAQLARDPDQPFVHYLLGQYHLRVPGYLGGSRRAAVEHLGRAYTCAPGRGVDCARFAISYASALHQVGNHDEAARILGRHFAGPPAQPTPRLLRRAARADALLAQIRRAA